MSKLFLATAAAAITATILSANVLAATDPVPCEKMLSDVRDAVKTAKLADADKAKVSDLEQKGIERCKADDDAGADAFLADALKIMGK